MTKKNYVAIADIVAKEAIKWKPESKYAFMVQSFTDSLSDYFAKENPLFRRDMFMTHISNRIQNEPN